jgi:L,D-peptidoglycan transpeptidase YkuD (ErfK/YbiS/YcfS/YnhG family)
VGFACALGRSGIAAQKREGDGATPAGRFAFRRVLFRRDQAAAPLTALPLAAIERDDGWCDDAHDPAYNRMIRLPFAASHERLWREDRICDLV